MENFIQRVPKTDLARKTRKVLASIRNGQTIVIENHGQEEAAIMDILDYRIQRAFICHYTQNTESQLNDEKIIENIQTEQDEQTRINLILSAYLEEMINLNRAAELLDIPWLDLRSRFLRLSIPLRVSPATIDDAKSEIEGGSLWGESS